MIRKRGFQKVSTFLIILIFAIVQMLCFTGWKAFASTTWEPVGNPGFTDDSAFLPSIAIDSNNIPYVVFNDQAHLGKVSVMKFNGVSWEYLGSPGFSEDDALSTAIAIDSDNKIYVAYSVYVSNLNVLKASVMKFNGTSWEYVGSPGFYESDSDDTTIAIDSDNKPYISYSDYVDNVYKVSVMKFNGINWEYVGNPQFSEGQVLTKSLAIDSNNIPYVVNADKYYNIESVMRFNGTSWEYVGNPFNPETNYPSSSFATIAIGSDNKPYISYTDYVDNVLKASVITFDGTNWEYLGNRGFSGSSAAHFPSIALDSNNKPYVAYLDWDVDGDSPKETVMRFNGTNWEYVGTPRFSESNVIETAIAIDSNNIPYVVYLDFSRNGKATVMKVITNADTPTINTQPADTTVNVGGTASIFVDASVTPPGILSYQWYSNTENNNSTGQIITGATDSSYSIPTSTAGITYYYCVITNTDTSATGNQTALTTSDIAKVDVRYVMSAVNMPVNKSTESYKLGSTIPIKFQLMDNNNNFISTATAILSYANSNSSTYIEAGTFRYDTSANQYIFNLSTKGFIKGTYNLKISLDDGTSQTLQINIQ